MNRRWMTVGLCALLCAAQVWSKPTDDNKNDDSNYPEDDAELEDNDDTYDDSEGQDLPSGPVQLLTQPQFFRVPAGTNVYLPCEFVNAEKVLISWMKGADMLYAGNAKMSQSNRIELLNNYTLVIRNARPEDSSDAYQCEALDVKDRKHVVHRLLVESADSSGEDWMVRVLPQEFVELEQGESISLVCEARFDVRPKSIGWSREGYRLKADRETPNSVYIDIRNATRHLAGDYQCVVETGAAKPIIKHLKLRVKHAPEIEYEKEHVNARVRERDSYYTGMGVESNITCVVHAHPPVTKLHWFKDGHKIMHDERVTKSSSHKSHHVLTIKDTNKLDLGVYQCKAWNALGNATGPPINLRDTPDQPIFKNGKPVDDYIEFQWRVVSYKPIVQSELLYRKKGEQNWHKGQDEKLVSSIGKENIVQGKVRGLKPGEYEVKLRSRNDEEHDIGDNMSKWGPFSKPEKFDGEYKVIDEAESVRGLAMRPTISFMTLLFMISQLAYSCS